jgi:hypothetical protein
MQKILLGLLLAFSLVVTDGFSQNNSFESRWEVGLDLFSLIDKNEYPTYSIFLKRDINDTWAARARLGGQGHQYINKTALPGGYPNPYDHQSMDIFSSFGIERSLFRERTDFYVGVDFGFGYSSFGSQTLEGVGDPYTYMEVKNRGWSYQVSPFAGYALPLFHRFTLRAEVAFVATYERHNMETDIHMVNYTDRYPFSRPHTPPQTFIRRKFETFNYALMPFNQVLLTYKF